MVLLDHVGKQSPYTNISLFHCVEIVVVSMWVSYNLEFLSVWSGCLVGAQREPSRSLALCWLWKIFYKPSRKDLLAVHHLGTDLLHRQCPQWFQWLGHLHHGPSGLVTVLLQLDKVLVCRHIYTSPYTYWSLLLYVHPRLLAPIYPCFWMMWPRPISISQHTAGWNRQALLFSCKRTRSPHIPLVSSGSLSMCACSFLSLKVSHLSMLVTPLQGQMLSFRLETHLLCREGTVSCQLPFQVVAQLHGGSTTNHADVLEDTLAVHQVGDPHCVFAALCTYPGYSKPLSPPCSSDTPEGHFQCVVKSNCFSKWQAL